MQPFDPTKPVQTKDGREAILGPRLPNGQYVAAVRRNADMPSDNNWFAIIVRSDGMIWNGMPSIQLVNVPEKRTVPSVET